MKFFEDEHRKDKVTIAQYVTCGMVPCLLTSTDR